MAQFTKGHAKKGGKKKGTKNKVPFVSFAGTKEACERLKCNPADFLVALVNADREALGLTKRQKLDLKERRLAAEFLLSRLEPSLKSIEVTTQGGVSPVIIVPDKAEGSSWIERAQTVREEQQKVLAEKMGGA